MSSFGSTLGSTWGKSDVCFLASCHRSKVPCVMTWVVKYPASLFEPAMRSHHLREVISHQLLSAWLMLFVLCAWLQEERRSHFGMFALCGGPT